MTALTGPDQPADLAVLEPSDRLTEVPIETEGILWADDSAVPLHLNPPALTIWWHFDGATPFDEVVRGVADAYRETPERVAPAVRGVAGMLLDAGLLRNPATQAPAEPPPEPVDNASRLAAVVDERAAEWLRRRSGWHANLTVGGLALAVTANSEDVVDAIRARYGDLVTEGTGLAVRYRLIDAGEHGVGERYWLMSDSGLPLEHAGDVDGLLSGLARHLGEVEAVQSTNGVPLRLAVLEAVDHCVAVQWDLLASRPVLEEQLEHLGYRIRSGQWAVVDPDRRSVIATPALGAEATGVGLPLRGLVLWFGPGSLDEPTSIGEWVWSLTMAGCAAPDHRPRDRRRLVECAHDLVRNARVVRVLEPGPTSVLAALSSVPDGGSA